MDEKASEGLINELLAQAAELLHIAQIISRTAVFDDRDSRLLEDLRDYLRNAKPSEKIRTGLENHVQDARDQMRALLQTDPARLQAGVSGNLKLREASVRCGSIALQVRLLIEELQRG